MTRYPSRAKMVARVAMLAALAVIMGYIERILPLDVGLQGVKPGLSNIVVLTALYVIGAPSAACVSFVRVIVVSILFGGFSSAVFSFSGAIVSFCIMAIAKKMNFFSVPVVSMLGGVSHNTGQLAAAGLLLGDWRIFYYMPVLLLSGAAFGMLTGLVSSRLIIMLGRNDIP